MASRKSNLSWDGSDLGWFSADIIVKSWTHRSVRYSTLRAQNDTGIICILQKLKTPIPLIIEDCKSLFGLVTRGHHTITIGSTKYIMYRVPIDLVSGNPIDEVPISTLNRSHELRRNPEFLDMVRRTILVSNILHLSTNFETDIRIRVTDHGYVPVSYFSGETDLHRLKSRPLSLKLMAWLGEDYETVISETYNPDALELAEVLFGYRCELTKIVLRYGELFLWLIPFIIDRLAYYLILK